MYKIGVVGAGHLGKIHLKILQNAPFVNLVGFFDCDPKVREEISELINSVEQNSNKIHEAADVIYHLMVYLESNNINIENVLDELKKRQK